MCKQVDRSTVQSMLQAIVSSRLDYCNVLYAGLPTTKLARLQRFENAAARLSQVVVVTNTLHLFYVNFIGSRLLVDLSSR